MRRVGEGLGPAFGVADVVAAAAPLEVAVGRVARQGAALAVRQDAGGAGPRHRPHQRRRRQRVHRRLFARAPRQLARRPPRHRVQRRAVPPSVGKHLLK